MFSSVRDASKVGLVHLCGQLAAWNFALLDCQVGNPHTEFLGARPSPEMPFSVLCRALENRKARRPEAPGACAGAPC